jgi:phosphotransferase system  glucose/maltose/N-acetylglucosamine-specific IIC component
MFETMFAAPFAQSFGGSLGASLGGRAMGGAGAASAPLISGGGTTDGRAQFDGSGWTVSTGRSVAYGANVPPKPSVFDTPTAVTRDPGEVAMAQPLMAGTSPLLMLALGGVAIAAILKARKG